MKKDDKIAVTIASEIPAVSSEEYRIASEASATSKANITEGRHAVRAKLPQIPTPADLEDGDPSEDPAESPKWKIDAFRRDGIPIRRHEYDPSDGSDIIENGSPGEIEGFDAILRLIDDMRVVWTPGPSGGFIDIKLPQAGETIPTDERLGYSLCTVNGMVSLRVWKPAKTVLNQYPRKNKDGSDMIRASYIPLSETIITDVQARLQQICRIWMPFYYGEKCPRIPTFNRQTISVALDRIAVINGAVNPVLEIAQATDWDGIPRMADFFKTLGYRVPDGILSSEEEAYYLECVGRWTFLGLMERQIRPTAYDQILILWGDGPRGGGTGKSRTAQAIANGYVGPAGAMPREKTASTDREFWKSTVGNAVCEMVEGQQWTKFNNDALKALADQSTFSYVEKYEKNPQKHDVGCIFICTTNKKEIIQDPDGNTRRFLPLMASRNADGEYAIDVLLRLELEEPGYVDQIYAEALTTIENSPVPCEVWRNGSESGRWAYDAEFMHGIQARVCMESLEKDTRVEDLAQFIKDRLKADSEAIDTVETVEASEIEQQFRAIKSLDEIGYDEHRKICRALHKSGTAKLYGLDYRRYTVNKRTIWGYRLLPDDAPGGPAESRRSPPSSKATGQIFEEAGP